jgi:hypothetical protein
MRSFLSRFAVFTVVMALSAATFAAPIDDLKAATQELATRNDALKAAIGRYEAKEKEKAAVDARLAALKKELDATTDPRKRMALGQEIRDTNAKADGILAVMLEYQRLVAKEARENRTIAQKTREIALRAKTAKIKTDNGAIDKGMEEARERADAAMNQATTMLGLSVVSAALAVVSAAAADGGK